MAVAPAEEHKDGPDAGPIESGLAGLERLPESGDGWGVQSDGAAEVGREQGVGHCFGEAALDPFVEGEDESGFGTVEQFGVEAVEADVAEDLLAAEGEEALIVGDAVDGFDQDAVDEGEAGFDRHGHAGGVGVAQEALAEEAALFENGDGGES